MKKINKKNETIFNVDSIVLFIVDYTDERFRMSYTSNKKRSTSNRFENLDEDEDYDYEKLTRKAKKKIKEINNLKKKENLTNEEKNKLDNEDYWLRILNPLYENEEQKKANIEKEKQYQETRNKKQQQREHKKKQKEHKKEQREYKKKQKEQKEDEKKFKVERVEDYEKVVLKEFKSLLSKGTDFKKIKHKLLLKYHPDKNTNKSASEIAKFTEITRFINDITYNDYFYKINLI